MTDNLHSRLAALRIAPVPERRVRLTMKSGTVFKDVEVMDLSDNLVGVRRYGSSDSSNKCTIAVDAIECITREDTSYSAIGGWFYGS